MIVGRHRLRRNHAGHRWYTQGTYIPCRCLLPARNRSCDHSCVSIAARTVLISSASSGLGRATAQALARTGARVLVHARTKQRAVAVAHELAGVPVWADLGSVAGV